MTRILAKRHTNAPAVITGLARATLSREDVTKALA